MFIRLRTARPDDWSGKLTDLAVTLVALLTVIIVLLVRLPESWVALAAGRGWLVRMRSWPCSRGGCSCGWTTLLRVLLPRTPYLFGRTLTIRARGRRVPLPVREIQAIHVETRPPDEHETFVVELRSGEHHDLCPVHWQGAGPDVPPHRPRSGLALSGSLREHRQGDLRGARVRGRAIDAMGRALEVGRSPRRCWRPSAAGCDRRRGTRCSGPGPSRGGPSGTCA
jgi:hypothetical protein